ncbi:MAG: hypothetical protein FWG30_12125, partial [Eubacteriaceae bacterium]|nr:hypothetical protein [Eubacteriaceae bacterium]
EFSPAYSYAAGDLVSFSYTYENVVPGAGFRPGLDMYAYGWRFVCIDEVDDSAPVEAWSASEAYEVGDIVSMDSANYFSPRITYICLGANTDSPPPASDYTEDPTEFWCPISAHNPVLAIEEGDLKLERLSGIEINSDGQLVIALGGLGISQCSFLDCAAPLVSTGAVSIGRLSSARFQKRLYASSISMRHVGTSRFAGEVGASSHIYLAYNGQAAFEGNASAGAYIAHKSSGNVHYSGTVSIGPTDTGSRTAISVSGGTVAIFDLGITAVAYAEGEGNYASGLLVDSGSRAVLGPSAENTFGGFNYAIYVEGGATVLCNSWQTYMQALNNYNYPVYGVYVGEGGMFVSGKGTEYDWENSYEYPYNKTKDRTEPRGVYVDLKKGASEGSGGGGSNAVTAYFTNTPGVIIRTQLESWWAGITRLEFKGCGCYQPSYSMVDTVIEGHMYGDVIETFHQINLGLALPPAMVFFDSDGFLAIYIGGLPGTIRIDAVLTFLLSGESTDAMGEAPEERYVIGLENSITAIEACDDYETALGYAQYSGMISEELVQNSLYAPDMSKTVFIATGNGDDFLFTLQNNSPLFTSRTVARALKDVPRNADVTLVIVKHRIEGNFWYNGIWTDYFHKFEEYDNDRNYWCYGYGYDNPRVTYQGHVFERVESGAGVVPSLGMTTPWRHVNIEEPTRGEYSPSDNYYLGDTVSYGSLTYVCVQEGSGQTPTISVIANPYWRVCGEYNPIVMEDPYSWHDATQDCTKINNLGSVTIESGMGDVEIIFIGDLDVASNKWLTVNADICVTGKLIADYIGGVTWNTALNVGSISMVQAGSCSFLGPVNARGEISHEACSCIVYNEAVTILKTDSLSANGIKAYNNTRLSFLGEVNITGLDGLNTGSGIQAGMLSTISTYGNCTVNGFARQIHSTSGGTIENNSSSYVLGKGGNTGATVTAIQADPGSKVIVNKGSIITRNNSIADSVNAKAVLYTYT